MTAPEPSKAERPEAAKKAYYDAMALAEMAVRLRHQAQHLESAAYNESAELMRQAADFIEDLNRQLDDLLSIHQGSGCA